MSSSHKHGKLSYDEYLQSERVDLLFSSNSETLKNNWIKSEKDFLYYLRKISKTKRVVLASRQVLNSKFITELFQKKEYEIILKHLLVDKEEFGVLTKIALHVFEEEDLEFYCRLLDLKETEKGLVKNFAYLRRRNGTNKANTVWQNLLSNSQIFIQYKFNPFISWLFVLSYKQNYYAFYRLLKSKIKLLEESQEVQNVVNICLYSLSPHYPETNEALISQSFPKLLNCKFYYREKIIKFNCFSFFENE